MQNLCPSTEIPRDVLEQDVEHPANTATGIRTPVSGLRIQRPSPLDDSGRLSDLSERKLGDEGKDPVGPKAVFQPWPTGNGYVIQQLFNGMCGRAVPERRSE